MRKYIYILLVFTGLASILSSCNKDETKTVILASPKAPVITTAPDLVLKRLEASKVFQIIGTKADYGFDASVTYNLEAAIAGTGFASPILIASNSVDTFNLTATVINSALIKTLAIDQTLALELRVRAVLTIEASGATPNVVISAVKAVSVTTYGPATLNITTAGVVQSLTSITDNKIYTGWIYTDGTGITFVNKDDGKKYGGTLNAVAIDGTPIALEAGAYNFTVNLTTGIATVADVTIALIGDATPGKWATDTKMVWGFTDHTWNSTNITIVAGGIKFRTFGGWASVNVAYNPAGHDLNNLYQSIKDADSQNIDNIAPGQYNIKLYLETTPMKVVFTPVTK